MPASNKTKPINLCKPIMVTAAIVPAPAALASLPADDEERVRVIDQLVKAAIKLFAKKDQIVVSNTHLGPMGLKHSFALRKQYHKPIKDSLESLNAKLTLKPNDFADPALKTVGDVCDLVNEAVA